ncbi:hypothetical protein PUN4_550166 [Paraburkholderia unamae]|nr:hypothetical protein PUN4_550166 [Paraburkholderia unamae]
MGERNEVQKLFFSDTEGGALFNSASDLISPLLDGPGEPSSGNTGKPRQVLSILASTLRDDPGTHIDAFVTYRRIRDPPNEQVRNMLTVAAKVAEQYVVGAFHCVPFTTSSTNSAPSNVTDSSVTASPGRHSAVHLSDCELPPSLTLTEQSKVSVPSPRSMRRSTCTEPTAILTRYFLLIRIAAFWNASEH